MQLIHGASPTSDPVPSKQCGGTCKRVLPLSGFSINNGRPDGRNLYCKECTYKKVKQSRQNAEAQKLAKQRRENISGTFADKVCSAIREGAVTEKQIADKLKLHGHLRCEFGSELADMVLNRRTLSACEVNGILVYRNVQPKTVRAHHFCQPCSHDCREWLWHGVISSGLCAPQIKGPDMIGGEE